MLTKRPKKPNPESPGSHFLSAVLVSKFLLLPWEVLRWYFFQAKCFPREIFNQRADIDVRRSSSIKGECYWRGISQLL